MWDAPNFKKNKMKRVKKILKIFAFIGLLMLAMAGIGLPIPMFYSDRFATKQFHQEQVDEEKEKEELEN